ncbi:MAG: response regulator [Deltaproteobacteria bacterium]|nr:response regulator [Deltaproteobacteria bacterium]
MCHLLGGYSSTYYAGVTLAIVVFSLFMPWKPLHAAINCLIIYLIYIILAYQKTSSVNYLINNSYFLLSSITIGIASSHFNYQLRLKEFNNRSSLEKANIQLKALDQAKTRFFTNLTHEFRTPLVSLSTLLQMIGERISLDSKLSVFLKSSSASLDEMLENINDLLSKTKSDQGFLQMNWAVINIVELVSKTVEIFKPIAAKKNLHLRFKNLIGSSTLQKKFYGDSFKLKKILNNIINNAIKYTQKGQIEVSLHTKDNKVIIQIKDSGIGIPKDELETIFKPFTQASNNTLRDVKGTGLGLSIVKDFAEAHQGKVTIKSQLNRGTQLSIELPLGKEHIEPHQIETKVIDDVNIEDLTKITDAFKNSEIKLSELTQKNSYSTKLLLVDDNIQVLQALYFILKDDYQLNFAQDGEEAFKKSKKIKPDLIISDIMMPNKNGYEFLQSIRQDYELKNIPLILLTAKVDIESKLKGLDKGANDYISKPFNILEVKSRIKNLLEHKKLERELLQNQEQLASLGKLISGVTHEIMNPIAYAKSAAENIPYFLQALSENKEDKTKIEKQLAIALDNVQDGIHRVSEVIHAIRLLSPSEHQDLNFYDIHQIIDAALKIIQVNEKSSEKQSKLNIHRNYQLKDKVPCHPRQLSQVFLNLLTNAAQASEQQMTRHIWISTSQDTDFAKISIKDNGPGIPQEYQNKIFHPFFTTKTPEKGSGLGLYISKQIINEHQGTIELDKSTDENTEFKLLIPLYKDRKKEKVA